MRNKGNLAGLEQTLEALQAIEKKYDEGTRIAADPAGAGKK